MSLALVFSMTIPALANTVYDNLGETPPPITGDGDVSFVEFDEVVRIIVPTTAALDFSLDPLGLSALIDGGEGKTLAELQAGEAAGKIVFGTYTPVVVNESSHPVLVKFGAQITGGAVTAETDPADVNTGVDNKAASLYIGMSASTASVTNLAATASTFAGTKQLPLTAASQDVTFLLDEAEYLIYREGIEYVYKMNPAKTGFGTQLLFQGICNPYGDWSDFVGSTDAVDATTAVRTYVGLADIVDALVEDDTITFGSTVFTLKDTPGATNFEDLTGFLAALNTAFAAWDFDDDDGDIIATAKVAGAIGGTGPAENLDSAVVFDGDENPTVPAASTVAGADAIAAGGPTSTVGLRLVFTFDEVDDETVIPTSGVYGLVEPAISGWRDVVIEGTPPVVPVGFTGTGTTPKEATISIDVGDTISIPFNFGEFTEFYAFLVGPPMVEVTMFGFETTASTIEFDTADWAPFVGSHTVGIWLQLTDLDEYYEINLTITEPDPGP